MMHKTLVAKVRDALLWIDSRALFMNEVTKDASSTEDPQEDSSEEMAGDSQGTAGKLGNSGGAGNSRNAHS